MILRIFARFLSGVLSLRYTVTWKNTHLLSQKNPVLVLPNHPALIDPILLLAKFSQERILSPIVTETYFHAPGMGFITGILQAIPVGDIDRGGSIEDVKGAQKNIKGAIEEGKSILLYPSGHIYVQPFEHIVGKKMAYDIVGLISPETRIILIRTQGLWGSIWSKAYTGQSPDLGSVIAKSIWYLVSNFFFFLPKRKVIIECVDMTETVKEWHSKGLQELNQSLEKFYNHTQEICTFIPHYFFWNDVSGKVEPKNIPGSIEEIGSGSSYKEDDFDPEILLRVRTLLSNLRSIPIESVQISSNLILDFHADSLDLAEMKSLIQSNFQLPSNPPISQLKTVGDLVAFASGLLQSNTSLPDCHFLPRNAEKPLNFSFQKGETLLTKLRENFRKYPDAPFTYDVLTQGMNRDQFLLRSYVLAQYFSGLPGDRIGIMMPALSATSLLLAGTYLSGKFPVFLNWTVGETSFAHCMQFAGLDFILTSRVFYKKISSNWLAKFEPKMIFIEDIISQISLGQKLFAAAKKTFGYLPKLQSDTAVMLFTSGSESLPKAVVLTHENILSDIAGALHWVDFSEHEIFLGFLPPFHSFGFTLNTIFPLIAPVQVAYSPDPNDAKTLVSILNHTKATICSATPTFLRMMLSQANSTELQSLRYVFAGAEKCSPELFQLFSKYSSNGKILEGYGITECSPIVSVNPSDRQVMGSVGKILPELQISLRSCDTQEEVSPFEQGMIYIHGPSIFHGYLDPSIPSPFEEFNGKKYYKTGDLGYMDSEGYLFITGRLKRFVKIAGEMISLPALESALGKEYSKDDELVLAVEALEDKDGVQFILFSIFDLPLEEWNACLRRQGVSNLVKFSKVFHLSSIPVLGTGKTDYSSLKKLCIESK